MHCLETVCAGIHVAATHTNCVVDWQQYPSQHNNAQKWPNEWAQSVNLASKFPRSQSNQASVVHPGSHPTHGCPMWQLPGLKVLSTIVPQIKVVSRNPTDAQLDYDSENLVAVGVIAIGWTAANRGPELGVGQCLGEWSPHECKDPSVSQQNISLQEDGQSCWFLSSVVLMFRLIRGYFVLFYIMNVFLANMFSLEKQTWSQWDYLSE